MRIGCGARCIVDGQNGGRFSSHVLQTLLHQHRHGAFRQRGPCPMIRVTPTSTVYGRVCFTTAREENVIVFIEMFLSCLRRREHHSAAIRSTFFPRTGFCSYASRWFSIEKTAPTTGRMMPASIIREMSIN